MSIHNYCAANMCLLYIWKNVTEMFILLNGQVVLDLTQTGLIDQILEDVGLTQAGSASAHVKYTPATVVLQPSSSDCAPADTHYGWKYRSIVGKLSFLANNTRPDIAMAVHQCARYVNNPAWHHYQAVKMLLYHSS